MNYTQNILYLQGKLQNSLQYYIPAYYNLSPVND
jgi:hypothetical protein